MINKILLGLALVFIILFTGSFAMILATANKAAIAIFSAGLFGLVAVFLVAYLLVRGKEARQWIKMLKSSSR